MDINRKIDGFEKERILVLPQPILDKVLIHPLIQPLYLTDIGFYPKAQYHYRMRQGGCSQAILILCILGEGVIEIQEKKYYLSQNQFMLIPANIPHCYYANKDNPWSIHWLHFNGSERDTFSMLFNREDDSALTLTNDMVNRVVKEFDALYQILTGGYSTPYMLHLSSTLRNLLTLLLLDEGHVHSQRVASLNYIDAVMNMMKQHIDRSLSLEELAEHVSLSKNYLVNLFHKRTGYSPVDYFIHLKMQQACQYLDTTELSIKEISLRVGYQDAYYFSRIFKKIMQQSPKEYRRLSKG